MFENLFRSCCYTRTESQAELPQLKFMQSTALSEKPTTNRTDDSFNFINQSQIVTNRKSVHLHKTETNNKPQKFLKKQVKKLTPQPISKTISFICPPNNTKALNEEVIYLRQELQDLKNQTNNLIKQRQDNRQYYQDKYILINTEYNKRLSISHQRQRLISEIGRVVILKKQKLLLQ